MKYEWKKQEKELYREKTIPYIIDVPPQKYIILSGTGNPNDKIFSEKVGTLFLTAYGIKKMYKSFSEKSHNIDDYSVYPLEGIWSKIFEEEKFIKSNLHYTIMIRQPNFITKEIFEDTLKKLAEEKPNIYLSNICLETIQDGKCIQILHKGTFDNEPESFEIMDRYCSEHSYKRIGKMHREIYLNNINRIKDLTKLKTILRYKIMHIRE